MVQTVVLHIGRHKTGTTSIQATMRNNHRLLKEQGVLYPRSLPACHSAFFVNSFCRNPERHPVHNRARLTRQQIRENAKEKQKSVAREIRQFPGEKVVMSGEDACTVLQSADVEKLKAFFDAACPDPVAYHVLLYTRHPVSRAQSGVQQLIKGNRILLEEARGFHLKGGGKKYQNIYDTYAPAFSGHRIEFRSFETAMASPHRLMGDFFETVGVNWQDRQLVELRRNESISHEILLFLSSLYMGPRSPEDGPIHQNRACRVDVSEKDKAQLFNIKGAVPELLSFEDKQTVWNNSQDDIAFLADKFGICYDPPVPMPDRPHDAFGRQFQSEVDRVLPLLDPPLAAALAQFVEDKTGREN